MGLKEAMRLGGSRDVVSQQSFIDVPNYYKFVGKVSPSYLFILLLCQKLQCVW
jgi:hypothetical protein